MSTPGAICGYVMIRFLSLIQGSKKFQLTWGDNGKWLPFCSALSTWGSISQAQPQEGGPKSQGCQTQRSESQSPSLLSSKVVGFTSLPPQVCAALERMQGTEQLLAGATQRITISNTKATRMGNEGISYREKKRRGGPGPAPKRGGRFTASLRVNIKSTELQRAC